MSETTKTNEGSISNAPPADNNPQPQNDKTFTQDEVNRIVSDRLKEDRQKREAPKPDPLAEREAELAKREFQMDAKEILRGRGFNAELLDALHATDKETLEASLAIIEKVYGDPAKPAPRFTALSRGASRGPDPIRDAMGLPTR